MRFDKTALTDPHLYVDLKRFIYFGKILIGLNLRSLVYWS